MFYRVAGFKKDDDTREMVIKAVSKKDAAKQIPAAKEFLFPGEKTEDYYCSVMEVPIKVNLGTTIPHYRITVVRPKPIDKQSDEEDYNDSGWWETILNAENTEAAKESGRQMIRDDGENPDDYDMYADEMTVDECIKEEEHHLRHNIQNTYMHLKKLDQLSVKEYFNFQRTFDIENNPEQYYEALKAFNKYIRLLRGTIRECNQTECSVERLLAVTERLFNCDDRQGFDKILKTLNLESLK